MSRVLTSSHLEFQPSKHPSVRARLETSVFLVLTVASVLIYGQTLSYPFISFDDPAYVVRNPHVAAGVTWDGWKWAWTSLEQSNWHPLTWLSLMLDAQMYGRWAGGFHLTNLLLHTLNAALLFRWLRTSTGAWWPSVLTALCFVAHPLHVESVAWVTERKDVLSTCFFCLTLLAYTHHVRTRIGWSYAAALASFALGLTAKPMLVTLPLLLCLLDYWPLRRWGEVSWQRLALEKAPFVILAAASCAVTILAQRAQAMVPLDNLPPAYRAVSAVLGYGAYLRKTMLPTGLGIYYPYWQAQSRVWPLLWATVLVGITLAAWWQRRQLPAVLVGWAWFVGTLVPVIGVVQVGGQAMADRYTYLPHIGLFIAIFWTGAAAWNRWQTVRAGLLAVAALSVAACIALAWRQAGYWRNSATLFEHTTAVVQPSGRLYHLLGDALLEQHQPAEATTAYLRAWRLGGLGTRETVLPLSTLLLNAARWPEATEILTPWRDRNDATPDLLNNLAVALTNMGQADAALPVYQRCVERFPDFVLAHFGLAALLQAKGEVGAAAAQDEAGLGLRPDWVPALTRLAWNYTHSDNLEAHESAQVLAQQAVKLTGGHEVNSLNVLAFTQAVNGRWEDAAETAAKALEVATATGESSEEIAHCRQRLECYERRQLSL